MASLWVICAMCGCGPGAEGARETDAGTDTESEVSDVIEVTPAEYEEADLAGFVFHQVGVSGDGAVVATFTYAFFQEPAPTQVPLTSVRPERCSVDDYAALFEGTRDMGASVTLGAGTDSLRLTKDLSWESGQIVYLREGEGEGVLGATPGAELSFQGTNTAVAVPNIPTMPDTSFWPELIDTGTLRLRWTPSGADHVQVGILWYEGAEDKPGVVCSLEDDGEAVIATGAADRAGWSAIVSFMPLNRGRVTVPDVGEVEVVSAIPMAMHHSPTD